MKTSKSIENISKALVKFQATAQNPKNTAVNPFHKNKYAPLDVVINTIRPLLAENGLALIQDVEGYEDRVLIRTRLLHESGEWIESEPLDIQVEDKKGTSMPQATGIAITYGRRYQLSAFLNISSEDDNDGSTDNPKRRSNGKTKNQQAPQQNPSTNGKATQKQLSKLYATANEKGVEKERVKQKMDDDYNVESSKELTKQQASDMIEWLSNL